MKTVYVGMSADYLHVGHINIINEALKYGEVTIGLLTDKAIASYKRVPMSSYINRKKVMEGIKGIVRIVPQDTLDYRPNLLKYKPDIVVHANDWKHNTQKEIRQQVIDTIKDWNGKLIEPPYTDGISSTKIIEAQLEKGVTPDFRRSMLKKLLTLKPYIKVIEAHNGLSALIAEKYPFDAIWESSLTDSTSKGKPDIEIVDFTSRCKTINEIIEVTTKPIIVDGDTGGPKEHFGFMVRTLERLGVSAIIIEDKKFPKENSLGDRKHSLEDISVFCKKIEYGRSCRVTDDFMVIARIETLIADGNVSEAIFRAHEYINAGADGIMIHSKKQTPTQLIEFCSIYKNIPNKVPLVLVPTTYNKYYESDLNELGANIIIYANHLLRSSYTAMNKAATSIIENKRSRDIDNICCNIKEILKLCPR